MYLNRVSLLPFLVGGSIHHDQFTFAMNHIEPDMTDMTNKHKDMIMRIIKTQAHVTEPLQEDWDVCKWEREARTCTGCVGELEGDGQICYKERCDFDIPDEDACELAFLKINAEGDSSPKLYIEYLCTWDDENYERICTCERSFYDNKECKECAFCDNFGLYASLEFDCTNVGPPEMHKTCPTDAPTVSPYPTIDWPSWTYPPTNTPYPTFDWPSVTHSPTKSPYPTIDYPSVTDDPTVTHHPTIDWPFYNSGTSTKADIHAPNPEIMKKSKNLRPSFH